MAYRYMNNFCRYFSFSIRCYAAVAWISQLSTPEATRVPTWQLLMGNAVLCRPSSSPEWTWQGWTNEDGPCCTMLLTTEGWESYRYPVQLTSDSKLTLIPTLPTVYEEVWIMYSCIMRFLVGIRMFSIEFIVHQPMISTKIYGFEVLYCRCYQGNMANKNFIYYGIAMLPSPL